MSANLDRANPFDGAIHHLADAFGLRWRSDQPLPQFAEATGTSRIVDIEIQRIETSPDREGGQRVNNGEIFFDGTRFRFGDAVFDTFDGARITWSSPSASDVPAAFYGTVVAHVLAWRGLTPLHGSAVAVGGKAVLIAGDSGAGKSMLCHALVMRGGDLISDDLSVLAPLDSFTVPHVLPGRPAIRLADPAKPASHADKLLVRGPHVEPDKPIPLVAVIVLRDQKIAPGVAEAAALLEKQLFRPQWMRQLPGRAERMNTLLHAAQRLTFIALPPASAALDTSVGERAETVIRHLLERGLTAPFLTPR